MLIFSESSLYRWGEFLLTVYGGGGVDSKVREALASPERAAALARRQGELSA